MAESETRDIVMRLEARMLAGEIFQLAGRAPSPRGGGRTGHRLSGVAPTPHGAASSTQSAVLSARLASPPASLSARLQTGIVMRASLSAAAPHSTQRTKLSGRAPTPRARAHLLVGVAASGAFALNIKRRALTEYSGFAFTHFARFGGTLLAATAGGLFALDGDTDDGDLIAAEFTIPPADFNTRVTKRLPYVYVGSDCERALLVTSIADEKTQVSAVTQTIGRNRRAKLARGVLGVLWSVRVANQSGAPFSIDTVELVPEATQRKV